MAPVRIGRKHPAVSRLRALRRSAAVRRAEGVFVAEGLHAVAEALDGGARLECAVVAPALGASAEGRALLGRLRAAADLELLEADDALMQTLQDARSAQPALAVALRPPAPAPAAVFGPGGTGAAIVLDGVQDPGNVGAVLRTAEAAGAGPLWACGGADPYHPRAVRASQGSVFRLPPGEGDAAETIDALRAAGATVLGADAEQGEPLWTLDWPARLALALGGEGGGLSPAVRARVDRFVRVPMRPPVESLSVGIAAAAILFERARRLSAPPDG